MHRDEPIPFTTGVAIAGWALAVHYATSLTLVRWHVDPEVGSAASHAATALVILFATPGPDRLARLGVRRPPLRFLIAAVLCGLTLSRATAWLNRPIEDWLGPESGKSLTTSGTLAIGLLGGSLLVPFSEELVFRGVLARSLSTRWSAMAAIALSALAFMLYHCNPYQLTPIFVFGAIAAFLTLRSGSIVPSIVMHALNNGKIALELAGIPAPFLRWTVDHHQLYLGACAFFAFTGVWIARARIVVDEPRADP
jgi:membrane protease YdiL (CAAX protease family)